VVVLDMHGRVLAGADDTANDAGAADALLTPAAARRKAVEQLIAARIEEALGPVFGRGYFEVAASIAAPVDQTIPDPSDAPVASAKRDYPVDVRLTPKVGLSARVIDLARAIAGKALGSRGDLGDTIAIAAPRSAVIVAPPVAAVPSGANPAGKRPSEVTASPAMPDTALFVGATVGAAILILLAMLLMRRRRSATNGYASEDNRAFAEHLESLLGDGEASRGL